MGFSKAGKESLRSIASKQANRSSAALTFLLFVIGILFIKAVSFSPYSNSLEVPYQSGLNAFFYFNTLSPSPPPLSYPFSG